MGQNEPWGRINHELESEYRTAGSEESMEEKAKQIAELLKILANENRLMILCALMEEPMAVGKIAERVTGITQPALSQHLSMMKAAGILDSEKRGQSITYSILDHRVEEVMHVLKQHYCDI